MNENNLPNLEEMDMDLPFAFEIEPDDWFELVDEDNALIMSDQISPASPEEGYIEVEENHFEFDDLPRLETPTTETITYSNGIIFELPAQSLNISIPSPSFPLNDRSNSETINTFLHARNTSNNITLMTGVRSERLTTINYDYLNTELPEEMSSRVHTSRVTEQINDVSEPIDTQDVTVSYNETTNTISAKHTFNEGNISESSVYKLTKEFVENEKEITKKWLSKVMPTIIKRDGDTRITNWTWFSDWIKNHSRFSHKLAIMVSCASYEKRMETFKFFPKNAPVKPEKLAEAGFFYLNHGTSVKCWSCSGVLGNWERDEDPFVEHCFYYPYCEFMLLERGFDYIRKVSYEKRMKNGLKSEVKREKMLFKPEMRLNAIPDTQIFNSDEIRSNAKPDTEVLDISRMSLEANNNNKEDTVANQETKMSDNETPFLCVICITNKSSALCLPGGMANSCAECLGKIKLCPICRVPIIAAVKIFLP